MYLQNSLTYEAIRLSFVRLPDKFETVSEETQSQNNCY